VSSKPGSTGSKSTRESVEEARDVELKSAALPQRRYLPRDAGLVALEGRLLLGQLQELLEGEARLCNRHARSPVRSPHHIVAGRFDGPEGYGRSGARGRTLV
jgi:hypothetical protein